MSRCLESKIKTENHNYTFLYILAVTTTRIVLNRDTYFKISFFYGDIKNKVVVNALSI